MKSRRPEVLDKAYASNDQEAVMCHLEAAESLLERLKLGTSGAASSTSLRCQEQVAKAKVVCWELYSEITKMAQP